MIYVCVEGEVVIDADGNGERLKSGEVIMIPAETGDVSLTGNATLLECYVE